MQNTFHFMYIQYHKNQFHIKIVTTFYKYLIGSFFTELERRNFIQSTSILRYSDSNFLYIKFFDMARVWVQCV